MKFVCNGMDLSDALSKVMKALPSKKSMPILEGIKFSAFGDTLTIMATDIDFVVIMKIKADIIMEGEVLVPGRTICEYIRKISKEKNSILKSKTINFIFPTATVLFTLPL